MTDNGRLWPPQQSPLDVRYVVETGHQLPEGYDVRYRSKKRQLLQLPGSCQGTFNSGGSTANLIALSAARQWACEQQGLDASLEGWKNWLSHVYTVRTRFITS